MRLTCLKCGHQMEVATGPHDVRLSCVCGQDYSYPEVVNTGTEPSEYAAERSRSKAFRAAGVVKNVGGFALGISLLGILFFPIALLGAGIGIYVLTMLRGPLGRYSGRRAAMAAVAIGSVVFLGEGAFAMNWLKARRVQRIKSIQASVSEDLRALLRAQRLFRATHDTYGTFREFRFRPPAGSYTYYLGPDDLVEANRDSETFTDPLPEGVLVPAVTESSFTAIAVANLDGDPFLDAWSLNDHGTITHLTDDAEDVEVVAAPPEEEAAAADEVLDATDIPAVPAEPDPAPEPAVAPKAPPQSQPQRAKPQPQPAKPQAEQPAKKPQPAKQQPEPAKKPQPEPAKPQLEEPAKAVQPEPEPTKPESTDPKPKEPTEPEVEPAAEPDNDDDGVKSIDELIDSAPG